MIFMKISQNFIKAHLKFCLISQISVHSLWHVWAVEEGGGVQKKIKRTHGAWRVIQKGQILWTLAEQKSISNIMWKSTGIFIGTCRLTCNPQLNSTGNGL